jgi:hypothetical protein
LYADGKIAVNTFEGIINEGSQNKNLGKMGYHNLQFEKFQAG